MASFEFTFHPVSRAEEQKTFNYKDSLKRFVSSLRAYWEGEDYTAFGVASIDIPYSYSSWEFTESPSTSYRVDNEPDYLRKTTTIRENGKYIGEVYTWDNKKAFQQLFNSDTSVEIRSHYDCKSGLNCNLGSRQYSREGNYGLYNLDYASTRPIKIVTGKGNDRVYKDLAATAGINSNKAVIRTGAGKDTVELRIERSIDKSTQTDKQRINVNLGSGDDYFMGYADGSRDNLISVRGGKGKDTFAVVGVDHTKTVIKDFNRRDDILEFNNISTATRIEWNKKSNNSIIIKRDGYFDVLYHIQGVSHFNQINTKTDLNDDKLPWQKSEELNAQFNPDLKW